MPRIPYNSKRTFILPKEFRNRADGFPIKDDSLLLVKKLARAYGVQEDLIVGMLAEESNMGKFKTDNPLQLSPDDRPRWDEAVRRTRQDPKNKALHFATMSMDRLIEGLERFDGDSYKASMWYHKPGDTQEKRYDPTYADNVETYRQAAVDTGFAKEQKYFPLSPEARNARKQINMSYVDFINAFNNEVNDESLGY